jgi:hypothetical protein
VERERAAGGAGQLLEQCELSPLERGMHALAATEKGRHGRSIAAYAEQVGRKGKESMIAIEVHGAKVAQVCSQLQISNLIGNCTHLAEIHASPPHCWAALVERMLKLAWAETRLYSGGGFGIAGGTFNIVYIVNKVVTLTLFPLRGPVERGRALRI